MRPALCRSKQCCQVLAIKVKVMNKVAQFIPEMYIYIYLYILKSVTDRLTQ